MRHKYIKKWNRNEWNPISKKLQLIIPIRSREKLGFLTYELHFFDLYTRQTDSEITEINMNISPTRLLWEVFIDYFI